MFVQPFVQIDGKLKKVKTLTTAVRLSVSGRSQSILHLRSSNRHQSTRLTTQMCTSVYVFRNSAWFGRKKQITEDAYGTRTHERVMCVDNMRTSVEYRRYVYKKFCCGVCMRFHGRTSVHLVHCTLYIVLISCTKRVQKVQKKGAIRCVFC